MAESTYTTVSGRNLATGWLADIHWVKDGRAEPVTMWLAAVTVVRQALGFAMYSTLEPEWRNLVKPNHAIDQVPGQWLIPLDIKAMEELALDGSQWIREVRVYDDLYSIRVEIPR